MPIKVRCKECGQGMAVPDRAAGRAVKCKGCGSRVAVPGEKVDGAAAAAKAPAKKKKKAAASGEGAPAAKPRPKKKKRRPKEVIPSFDNPDDMFSGLNLGSAEDEDVKLCPSCAQPVDEEEQECPACGVNIGTGAMSVEQKTRRARKGPPPEEYYGVVWKNGWKFVMDHKSYAFKTGLLWGFSATMVIISAFILNWYTRTRAIELVDSAEGDVFISETAVVIQPAKGDPGGGGGGSANYDGVAYSPGSTRLVNGRLVLPPPHIAAMLSPPTYFWAFIFLVFCLSFGGWAWVLSAKIIELTLAKQKKIKRFQGDMFGNMTKGFTTIAWPIVLMYPVIWIPGAMFLAGVPQLACIITFICLVLLPYFVFLPNAMVHMAHPYSYRAWLISWMGKDLLNTFVPALFTAGIFVILVLLLPLAIAIGVAVGWDQFVNFYMTKVELPALSSTMGYALADADFTGTVSFKRLPFMFLVSFISCTALFTILAFPAVMMMRIFGLFALYFREDMDVCKEQVPLSPVGFGPRFLAIQVDAIIATLIVGVAVFAAGFIAGLFQTLYDSPTAGQIIYWISMVVGVIGSLAFYFANWESGSGRATLGKWSFGMLVLNEDNSPMDFKKAVNRFLASLLTPLSLGITFLMCAFHPKYRAVHDTMTKTKVVWRGDENM